MNQELLDLLAECDPCGEMPAGRWSDFLLLANKGGVPPPPRQDPDFRWHRGFDVLVLDGRGRPLRYCKCRPAANEGLSYESSLLEVLSNDPSLRRIIPRTRGILKGDLRIQVSVYVSGVRYQSILPRISLAKWKASTHDILAAAVLISERASATIPRFQRAVPLVSPLEAASELLHHLASWDVQPENLEALEAALRRTAPLPRSPQHGDLWPSNILSHQHRWWILDFEMFGKVEVPMYDVYHLIRTSMEAREPNKAPMAWVDRMALEGADVCRSREIIHTMAQHYNLSAEQAIGAAVFYIIHIAATFRASKKRSDFWKPLMVEVDRIAAHLRAGSTLDRMLLGSP